MPGVAEFGKNPGPGEYRWTMYVRYPGNSIEEIDVNAATRTGAQQIAKAELDENYEPGWIEFWVEGPRIGFYL